MRCNLTNSQLQSDGKRGAACGISALGDSVKQSLCLCFGIMFPVVTGGLKTRDREPGSTWPFFSGPSQSHVCGAPALLCRVASAGKEFTSLCGFSIANFVWLLDKVRDPRVGYKATEPGLLEVHGAVQEPARERIQEIT